MAYAQKFTINLRPPRILWVLLIASAAALAGAYVAEYGFNLRPCILCLYQRLPYALAIGVLAITLGFMRLDAVMRWHKILPFILYLLAAIFAVGAVLAAYHTGVEHGVWTGPSICVLPEPASDDLDALFAQIMQTPMVRCDVPAFVFLGLSMAGWNIFYSGMLMMIAIIGARKAGNHGW
jgi:disulfide bond formation protein DsbB